jgi:hypothetical protein
MTEASRQPKDKMLRIVAGLVKHICDASVVPVESNYIPIMSGGSSAVDVVRSAVVSGKDKVVVGAADDARTAIDSLLDAPAAEQVIGSAADFVVARLPCQLVFGAQALLHLSRDTRITQTD